jgi:hypothetical protein
MQPTDGAVFGALIANSEIGGRDAQVGTGDGQQGQATWELASGGTGYASSYGLDADELHALVEQVEAGGAELPQGLRSVGMTDNALVSTSVCSDGLEFHASITQVRGSLPSRYAQLVGSSSGVDASRFDVGDTSVLIMSMPGTNPVGTAFHQASPEEWERLLDVRSAPPVSITAPPSATSAESDDHGGEVVVPSVVGDTRDEAEDLLNAKLGFGLLVQFVDAGPESSGRVVQQEPQPGTRAPNASTVVIAVGK